MRGWVLGVEAENLLEFLHRVLVLALAGVDRSQVRVGRALIRIEADGLLICFDRVGGLSSPFELLPQFKVRSSRGGVEADRLLERTQRFVRLVVATQSDALVDVVTLQGSAGFT